MCHSLIVEYFWLGLVGFTFFGYFYISNYNIAIFLPTILTLQTPYVTHPALLYFHSFCFHSLLFHAYMYNLMITNLTVLRSYPEDLTACIILSSRGFKLQMIQEPDLTSSLKIQWLNLRVMKDFDNSKNNQKYEAQSLQVCKPNTSQGKSKYSPKTRKA